MWPHQEEGKKCTGPPPTVHLQDSEVKARFQGGLPNSPRQGVAPHSTESSRRQTALSLLDRFKSLSRRKGSSLAGPGFRLLFS